MSVTRAADWWKAPPRGFIATAGAVYLRRGNASNADHGGGIARQYRIFDLLGRGTVRSLELAEEALFIGSAQRHP